jgi:phosphatidylserine/phosphatidylglycerophosphate/cardiolipin synthase-like enzyme
MRSRVQAGPISVQAIAGTHVVLLGMDVDGTAVDGLLGFAIERTDHTEGERYFLDNFLLFETNDTGERPDHSSETNPFQEFAWGDYTAKPDHDYTYAVTPMYGRPGELKPGPTAAVRIETEKQDGPGTHTVFFNRAVAASQAYARRFGNRAPEDVPNREAYKWLSRGLLEGLLAFIGQARDERYALRAAVYEFEYPAVVEAFKVAADAGADVRIVYDAIGKTTRRDNAAAIKAAGLSDAATKRTKVSIAHNKFIVLLRDSKPVAVWTGSTNLTEGGIFGHANVGHIVRDARVAARFLAYWELISGDPPRPEARAWNDADVEVPAAKPRARSRTTVFSPRSKIDALDWYVRLADNAEQGVFLTAAFGLGKEVAPMFQSDRPYLRYLLLDTERGDIEAVRRDPDNIVTAGGFLGRGGWRQWIEEKTTGLNGHVDYVHLKFMLVDPLSDDPIVITGSANWSDESAKMNDENMLVVRGDTRLADIYLGEFMRLFNHFRLRGKAKSRRTELEPGPAVGARERSKLYLRTSDAWAKPFFVEGSPEAKERQLFA